MNFRFSKTLLLGLAYACNYGGMMTPIASMQNVLAVSYLQQVRPMNENNLDIISNSSSKL